MINISLDDSELKVLKMSINHCLDTCKKGGQEKGCRDCETLEQVLHKIERH